MKAIILAARPKTLPAAIVPVWLGTVLAYDQKGVWSVALMVCTLLSALCIQVATNFFNDAIDARKGADTERRIGPKRVTASGMVPARVVFRWAAVFLVMAGVFSLYLIMQRGWVVLGIGVPSMYLAYGYTGGRFPLAYLGLGELFVFLFFGVVATMGTYFIQTGEWSPSALLLGAVVGAFSCFLISINNLRDAEEDASTGKKTLVVRLGVPLYKRLLFMMGANTSLAVLALWWWLDLQVGLEVGFLVLAWVLLNAVMFSKNPQRLNLYLALSGGLLVLFGGVFHFAVLMKWH